MDKKQDYEQEEWMNNYYYYPLHPYPFYSYPQPSILQPHQPILKQEFNDMGSVSHLQPEPVGDNQMFIKNEEQLNPKVFDISEDKQKNKNIKKRWQNSNKNKNIYPNTINRMISFLSCRARSQRCLQKFLQENKEIGKKVTLKQYFSYIKLLKPQMNRCLMQETVQKLFKYSDPEFKIFSQEQQECFIRINAFLFCYYVKSPTHILYLVHSNCLQKENIPDYIRADRQILNRIKQVFTKCSLYTRLSNQLKVKKEQ